MNVYANGGWRAPSACRIYAGGAWRTVTRVQVYKGGAWRTGATFADPLTASLTATPTDVLVSSNTIGYGSSILTATPSGGVAPYTYSHAITDHLGSVSPSLSTPTMATTYLNGGAYYTTTDEVAVTVTITDAIGQTATASVGVQFTNIFGT